MVHAELLNDMIMVIGDDDDKNIGSGHICEQRYMMRFLMSCSFVNKET